MLDTDALLCMFSSALFLLPLPALHCPPPSRLISSRYQYLGTHTFDIRHGTAPVAQWIRRLPTEQEILGSIPGGGTFFLKKCLDLFLTLFLFAVFDILRFPPVVVPKPVVVKSF